jgi:uncharacterized protein YbbC (DUF1343 family)
MIRGEFYYTDFVCSILKLMSIFLFIIFFPRYFLYQIHKGTIFSDDDNSRFKLGLENISVSFLKHLSKTQDLSYRVGLITNQTGRDQKGRSNIDILEEKGLQIKKIFTPENCLELGNSQKSTIPIISLYSNEHKWLDHTLLNDIDVLIFDMQDVGIRYYSYLNTLLYTMYSAAQYNKVLVVLDRPNLLGSLMEGVIMTPYNNCTDIPIPTRYGMTLGELAYYFNKHVLHTPVRLHVISMSNYERSAWSKNLPRRLSPYLPTINSCYGYSFLSLIGEVVPFDMAIGTDNAFQCILLPESNTISKKKWYELQVIFKKLGIESAWHRYFSTIKKEYCSGLKLSVANANHFSSFNTLLTVLKFFKNSGIPLSFSHNFDTALGGSLVREFLEGKIEQKIFESVVNKELKTFFHKATSSFLYKPFPKIVMV